MAADKTQLLQLMALRRDNLPDWMGQGKIPHHYKRMTVYPEKAMELAIMGQMEVNTYFGDKLYFTQALIAGAILSGEYHRIILCLSSQYGKSWLLGRLAVIKAHRGDTEYVAGGRKNTTEIIMRHMLNALQQMPDEIQRQLTESDSQKIGRAQSELQSRI